ncbi:MAG: site-2 protease family protein [Saprospiraceae bacterium]|nr:site-2 protease family protein [Saprospiraceae bacterium]MDW8482887.1 site-2 protease family protein [Saprospiraceae bacterium]
MRGSFKIFTWLGIPVYVHWTLVLLYLLGIMSGEGPSFWRLLEITGIIVVLFGCVLLHEYGHVLAARRYGIDTQDIILSPIGGVARMKHLPEKPIQELVVAIAGPLVNVLIAAGLYVAVRCIFSVDQQKLFHDYLRQHLKLDEAELVLYSGFTEFEQVALFYLAGVVSVNIVLTFFNLIPAFPMDGGRIFRALLAVRIGQLRATRAAVFLGQGIAALFVGISLWNSNISLAIIGLFIFILARVENRCVKLNAVLSRFKAADLVRSSFTRLFTGDWMQTPIYHIQEGAERHFLVFDAQDHLVGTLEEDCILKAFKSREYTAPVARYMRTQVQVVSAQAGLTHVYHLIRNQGVRLVAVAQRGELIGVIDEARLEQFLKKYI